MSDIEQKALDYFKSKPELKEVHFATKDKRFLFEKKYDAVQYAKSLDAENPEVDSITNENVKPAEDKKTDTVKKPTPAELKAIKDNTVKEYTELFGEAPESKLSAPKIQELIDAKKAELKKPDPDNENN